VLSVDEKLSIQAIQRTSGYVETDSGAVVRAMKSTYQRHGTLNLFAALAIASGHVYAQTTEQKNEKISADFWTRSSLNCPPAKKFM
jgi:hypothetical protein